MTYTQFLKISEGNKFVMCLTLDGEYLSFDINNKEDFNNVQKGKYDKVNFNRFNGEKLIKAYKTTKN